VRLRGTRWKSEKFDIRIIVIGDLSHLAWFRDPSAIHFADGRVASEAYKELLMGVIWEWRHAA